MANTTIAAPSQGVRKIPIFGTSWFANRASNFRFGSKAVLPGPCRERLHLGVKRTFRTECPVLGAFQKYPGPVRKVRV